LILIDIVFATNLGVGVNMVGDGDITKTLLNSAFRKQFLLKKILKNSPLNYTC
jgi:hypothetical protein